MSTTTSVDSAVRYEKDSDAIATILLDDPTGSANTMNEAFKQGLSEALGRLAADIASGDVKGVVVASAKPSFFAGGDLNSILGFAPEDAEAVYAESMSLKADLRRLETCGVPVVAAINGAALGGGYEICLATHHRIALDSPKVQIGLPEVTLGLLPGAGGVVRTVRLLGIVTALMQVLTTGTRFTAQAALDKGLVDELVASSDELLPAAKAWLLANVDDAEAAVQPWDRPGYKMPGGTPSHPAVAALLPAIPGNVRKQAKGVPYPAPRAIISAAIEGAQVDFANAEKIEGRYFANLATGRVAKAMIQAFFFDMQRLNTGALRPQGVAPWKASRLAVLGAGMMGAGIAYSSAKAGIEVVLKDVTLEAAERGKAYSERILSKDVTRGRITEAEKQAVLDRIIATADVADLAGCDSIIEAVFEDPELKKRLFAEAEAIVAPDALLGSNTSTLPITSLATGVSRPEGFIGVHFFSPVDKMKIVEIIRGEATSDETLAKTIDYVQQIKKIPIVVQDSRGFYTSRIIGVRMYEGLAMLAEGAAPWSIERATTKAGYPAPTLQLSDELNMELMDKIAAATEAAIVAEGGTYVEHPGLAVVRKMIEAGRPARVRGKGFYEYDESGARGSLWSGLAELFPTAETQIPFHDMMDRMVFAEALEAARCFEEGVIADTAAANIGGILALGFPAITGGPATFMTNYDGGLNGFVARANELADAYGDRFRPSPWLAGKAARGDGLAD